MQLILQTLNFIYLHDVRIGHRAQGSRLRAQSTGLRVIIPPLKGVRGMFKVKVQFAG